MKSSVTSKETGTNTRRRSITSNKSSNSRPTISRFFRPHKKFKERNEAAADDQHHRTAAITLATPGCEDGRPGPGAAPSSSGAEEGVEEEKEATNKEHTATTVPVSNTNSSTFAKADSVIELLDDDVDDDDSMEDKDKDDENENDAQTVVVAAVVSGNSGITTHTTTGRRPRGATAAAAESSGAETPPDDPEKEATENEKARTPVLHNPFAQFAYHTAERSTKEEEGGRTRTAQQRHTTKVVARTRGTFTGRSSNSSSVTRNKTKKPPFVKMHELLPAQQEQIVQKWQSMAITTTAPATDESDVAVEADAALIEIRRYQLVLVARLHARCQERTVRAVMQKLHQYAAAASSAGGVLTVDFMARCDPAVLATEYLSSLQYYNVKAQHVVKAAQEILHQHGGVVPHEVQELRTLPGIGPTFADLLAFVNTPERHHQYLQEQARDTKAKKERAIGIQPQCTCTTNS